MIAIEVKELCEVEYIEDEDEVVKEPKLAIRTITYESKKDTLLEAFQDYINGEFDIDSVIECIDEFDGGCLNTVQIVSVKDVTEEVY